MIKKYWRHIGLSTLIMSIYTTFCAFLYTIILFNYFVMEKVRPSFNNTDFVLFSYQSLIIFCLILVSLIGYFVLLKRMEYLLLLRYDKEFFSLSKWRKFGIGSIHYLVITINSVLISFGLSKYFLSEIKKYLLNFDDLSSSFLIGIILILFTMLFISIYNCFKILTIKDINFVSLEETKLVAKKKEN